MNNFVEKIPPSGRGLIPDESGLIPDENGLLRDSSGTLLGLGWDSVS
jgi:hypothetical protein